jgi:ParB-like chromosome segregation protein Spo0J
MSEFGDIEPLVVYPQGGEDDYYMLLDGHVRLDVAKELGFETADCLISTDDEAFTYNHKINRLSAIQEHFMIKRAIDKGVPEKRIAKTLRVDVASIRQKRDLLDGICPEAVSLLKDKRAPAGTIRQIRKVKPMRQIEMAELMIAANNYSVKYAKCLLAATPEEELVEADEPRELAGLTSEDMSRMKKEMQNLTHEFKLIENTHRDSVYNLIVVVGYLRKLLNNAGVVRYLSRHHAEILAEFQKLVETKSLAADAP